MPDLRDELGDPALIRFYDYWDSLCGDGRMPSRKNVDPVQVPRGFLPNIMLIDVLHELQRYRYRLVGSNIVTATGENRTGRFFDEVEFFKHYPAALQQYELVAKSGRPLYSIEPFTNFHSKSAYEVDRLIFPLSDDGRRVDTLLTLFQFKTGPFAQRLPGTLIAAVTPAGL